VREPSRTPDAVAALVDRIVADARIADPAVRDDLRRELLSHFREAGGASEAVEDALKRFGAD